MRCPYCRLIMADTEARCVRCGAVDQGGRWVRAGSAPDSAPSRPRVDPVGTPIDRELRVQPPAPTSPPSPAPPERLVPRGCVVAAVATVVVVALGAGALALAALAGGGGDAPVAGSSVPPAWSSEARDRFEGACRATGADSASCRCVRGELERRFTESQVDAMVAVLERGDPLSAPVRQQLREAQEGCADR